MVQVIEEEKSDTRKKMDEWVGSMSDEEAKEQFMRIKFDEFKIKHRDRLEMWFNANGEAPPPIRWDERILDYIWLSRDQRRQIEKRNRRIILPGDE